MRHHITPPLGLLSKLDLSYSRKSRSAENGGLARCFRNLKEIASGRGEDCERARQAERHHARGMGEAARLPRQQVAARHGRPQAAEGPPFVRPGGLYRRRSQPRAPHPAPHTVPQGVGGCG
ncbi:unnamed protein product, partial [Ectocarpus fasciculatus]